MLRHDRRAAYRGDLKLLDDPDHDGRHGGAARHHVCQRRAVRAPGAGAPDQGRGAVPVRHRGFDWRQVDPTIFGSLLERFLGKDSRSNLGIHYTHEADIGRSSGPRPRSVAQDSDEIVRRLLALNQEIASGVRPYDPFGASRTTGLPSPSSNSEEQESGATYVAQI